MGMLRREFQHQVRESSGKSFQDLFGRLMVYRDPDFQKVKPWGNIGDRKNDGYIPTKGIFFQVYAPEYPAESPIKAIRKVKDDFAGLRRQWADVREFHFVFNDKFEGAHPDLLLVLEELIATSNLERGGIVAADRLERWLFELSDDEIYATLNVISFANVARLPFSELHKVVQHIMALGGKLASNEAQVPDWDQKVKFNGLSSRQANFLEEASYLLGDLETFLAEEDFLAEELQRRLISLYQAAKDEITQNADGRLNGEEIFWELVERCLPGTEMACLPPLYVIFAKYFEACDIFEEPS